MTRSCDYLSLGTVFVIDVNKQRRHKSALDSSRAQYMVPETREAEYP